MYIRYLGACKGCPSAEVGTLDYIEDFLKAELDREYPSAPQIVLVADFRDHLTFWIFGILSE